MILVALGTRPELLKVQPLLEYWKSIRFNDWKIWLTGQHKELCEKLQDGHYDEPLSDAHDPEWIPDSWQFAKHIIENGVWSNKNMWYSANRLDHLIQSCLGQAHDINWQNINAVLVQGDTASAFACALAAFHRQIPIIHLEAGLRSYDNENPYPEEFYRRSISMMASLNLCPTDLNKRILEHEITPGTSIIVGNTVIDNIAHLQPKKSKKILCTLHRRENLQNIKDWFAALDHLAAKHSDYNFTLPIHKNPDIYKYRHSFQHVNVVEPLEHEDLIKILQECAFVITDSGGIAEEATWFKKRIFLCRKETERPEGLPFYEFIFEPKDLEILDLLQFENDYLDLQSIPCPFGDGKASEKIHKAIMDFLDE